MSTCATIRFEDDGGAFLVCRGHDGFPAVVMPDLEKSIATMNRRIFYPELGLLVAMFLGQTYEENRDPSGVPAYEVLDSYRGDESYLFRVFWDKGGSGRSDGRGCWKVEQANS